MPYEKIYDLLDLAIWMQSGREGVSINDIAQKFNVSRRTAERMRDLIVNKFPQTTEICGENHTKRWYIPQGTLKDFIQFSAEELAVLETAKNLLKEKSLFKKAAIFENVIHKVKACIKPDIMRKIIPDTEVLLEAEGFIFRPGPKLKINLEIIKTIQQAILECHKIRIKYDYKMSPKTSYNILNPYGFLYGERNHYLVACHGDGYGDGAMRNFILSNIKSVEILPEVFVFDDKFNLQEYAQLSFGAFHEEPFDVEWLFDAEVAKKAEQYIFHPKQKMYKNKDGSLTVKFTAGGRVEMDWHLYTWGEHVKVIKPENWKKN